jgi:hypothetical protein
MRNGQYGGKGSFLDARRFPDSFAKFRPLTLAETQLVAVGSAPGQFNLTASAKILGGDPGGFRGSSNSGVVGGRTTISRCLLARPLPLSFSSNGRQQSAQMSNSLPSISFWRHSPARPHKSPRITLPGNASIRGQPDNMKEYIPAFTPGPPIVPLGLPLRGIAGAGGGIISDTDLRPLPNLRSWLREINLTDRAKWNQDSQCRFAPEQPQRADLNGPVLLS